MMTQITAQDLEHCALPAALEAMGERWSFLILRGAMSGLRHFEEFQSSLGIARNILANRLSRLVENGIMLRQPMRCDRRKVEYLLTDKGQELAPVMIALRQWGERWGGGDCTHQLLADKQNRQPIQPVRILAQDGRPLVLDDLIWICTHEEAAIGAEQVAA